MMRLPPNASIFDALALDNVTSGDLAGFNRLLKDALPAVQDLTNALQEATTVLALLAEDRRRQGIGLADAQHTLNAKFLDALTESKSNPEFSFFEGARNLAVYEREVQLRQDALDYIEFVLIPSAIDVKLETFRDLKRAEHLEAALYAAISHADMLERMDASNLQLTHGRVAVFSEVIEGLKTVAGEAHRQAQLADAELVSVRAAEAARTQQRQALGQVTRAEAVFTQSQLRKEFE